MGASLTRWPGLPARSWTPDTQSRGEAATAHSGSLGRDDLVDLLEIFGGRHPVPGLGVGRHLPGGSRAGDNAGASRLRGEAADRDLQQADATIGPPADQRLDLV